jgi:DNA-binding transcriptional LysR family regulator
MRLNPSIAGLRALEAVVRTGSITAAAQDLCVTPAAISHRLAELEADAARPLLIRRGRQIMPTDEGRRVVDTIGDAFVRLRLAHQLTQEIATNQPLRVTAPTSFVLGWLIERLEHFYSAHPGISIQIEPIDDPMAPRTVQPDVVLSGRGGEHGAEWRKLSDCSYRVVYNSERLRRVLLLPGDLSDVPLIRSDLGAGTALGAPSWSTWLAANGVKRAPEAPEIEATQAYAAMRMAMFGQGVALISLHLTESAIAQGRLQELPARHWMQGTAMWSLVLTRHPGSQKNAATLLNWLSAELSLIYGDSTAR